MCGAAITTLKAARNENKVKETIGDSARSRITSGGEDYKDREASMSDEIAVETIVRIRELEERNDR